MGIRACSRGMIVRVRIPLWAPRICLPGAIGRRAGFRCRMFRVRISGKAPKSGSGAIGRHAELKPRFSCEFESRLPDHFCPLGAIGRRACLRSRMFRVRITERAPIFRTVAQLADARGLNPMSPIGDANSTLARPTNSCSAGISSREFVLRFLAGRLLSEGEGPARGQAQADAPGSLSQQHRPWREVRQPSRASPSQGRLVWRRTA